MTSQDNIPGNAPVSESATQEGSSFTERVICDPVGSVVAGIVAPTAAFGFVLSAMYGIALVS